MAGVARRPGWLLRDIYHKNLKRTMNPSITGVRNGLLKKMPHTAVVRKAYRSFDIPKIAAEFEKLVVGRKVSQELATAVIETIATRAHQEVMATPESTKDAEAHPRVPFKKKLGSDFKPWSMNQFDKETKHLVSVRMTKEGIEFSVVKPSEQMLLAYLRK